jgi:hypothetical protein
MTEDVRQEYRIGHVIRSNPLFSVPDYRLILSSVNNLSKLSNVGSIVPERIFCETNPNPLHRPIDFKTRAV